jgi:hypothetical protein
MAVSLVSYTARFFLQSNTQIEESDALLYLLPTNNALGPFMENLLQSHCSSCYMQICENGPQVLEG